jgi:NAD(P)-dependent dehydrogenase (short-subunit alcohol dehydrogenase family)
MTSAQGKTAIVTGAAGGLGKAIADAFLAAGANVVICDVNPQRLSAVREEWGQTTYAGKFLALQTDVTDEAAVQKLVGDAVSKFGRVDVLINNAGVMDDFSPVGACAKDLWDKVLAVNLTGPYLACKAAVAQMERQEPAGGSIVNIGSNASWSGFQAGAAYTVSKAGVVALTKNMAGFYGPKGIYSSALMLGAMATTNIADAMQKGINMEMYQAIQESQPKFVMEKHDLNIANVAKYVLFLTDKDIAASSNGSCIVFNKNWPAA